MNNIYIKEDINEDTLELFMQDVNNVDEKDKITVYLTSFGGDPLLVPVFRDIIERHQMRLVAGSTVYSAALDLFLLTNTPRSVLENTIGLVHRLQLVGVSVDKFSKPTVDNTLTEIWSEFDWDLRVAKLFNMTNSQIDEMMNGRDFYFNYKDVREALKKSEKKFANKKIKH